MYARRLGRGCLRGRGGNPLLYIVTVGTGISYCLMQNGQPLKGVNGNAITMGSSPLSTVLYSLRHKATSSFGRIRLRPGNRETIRTNKSKAAPAKLAKMSPRGIKWGQRCYRNIDFSCEALGVSVAFL